MHRNSILYLRAQVRFPLATRLSKIFSCSQRAVQTFTEMAQGNAKVKKAEASGGRKKGGVVKKGARAIAPKQAQKQREHKVQKVCPPSCSKRSLICQNLSSKINNSIERQMVQAASAGKLTIMRNSGGDVVEAGKGKGKAKGK